MDWEILEITITKHDRRFLLAASTIINHAKQHTHWSVEANQLKRHVSDIITEAITNDCFDLNTLDTQPADEHVDSGPLP